MTYRDNDDLTVCERCIYHDPINLTCSRPYRNVYLCYGDLGTLHNRGIPKDTNEFFKILGEMYYQGGPKK